MARRRTRGHRAPGKRFLFLPSLPIPGKRLLFLLLLGLLFWWAPLLGAALTGLWSSLLRWFGLGVFLPGLVVAVPLLLASQRKLYLLRQWWNIWVGALLWAATLLGLLAFLDYGGSVGRGIISPSALGGALRLTVLAAGGLALVAPRLLGQSLRAAARGSGVALVWLAEGLGRGVTGLRQFYSRHPVHRWLLSWRRKLAPLREETPPSPTPEIEREPEEKVTPSPVTPSPVASPLPEAPRRLKRKEPPSGERWQLPPLDLLEEPVETEIGQADIERRARLIEEALASYGVEAKVVQVNVGPTVTQFGVEPGWERKYKEKKERDKNGQVKVHLEEVSRTRVRVERIKSLTDDLALALAAPSIRIEAPVPGKPLVGIEVPNSVKGTVTLRGILESIPFRKVQARSRLAIALGRAAGGEAVVTDLSRMPHLLIAGATGSGKTVCLNCIITSLLMFNTPDELQLILVDPKRVELVSFNSIPHLAYPVIVEQDKAVEMLNWLNQEMDSRYRRMAIVGARNIEAYNHSARVDKPLPYVVVVIDELADLMMSRPEQVEPAICRLAQLARATGIHLVVATQRPSVDVITGLIKANFPSRISFAVTSQVDSRTILDVAGAERLLGRGDMLFLPPDASKPRRLQGCFISDAEIDRVVRFWAKQRLPLEEAAMAFTPPPSRGEGSAPDPLLEEARQLAKEHRQLSVSFLQRRLRIGYPRAVQLMEQLQAEEAPQAARAEPEENKS